MSVSNSVGLFDLDLINLRKPLKFNDGTTQSTAYTGSIGVPDLDHVLTSGNNGNGNDIVNIDVLQTNYVDIGNPYIFDDWFTLSASAFQWNYQNASGGRIQIYDKATLDASLISVGKFRQGLLQMLTNQPLTAEMLSGISFDKVYTTSNILSITFGFIPLGNGYLGAVGGEDGYISQGFGICSGNVNLGLTQNGIMWRLYSNNATVPSWSLVENNIVKETLSGTNLTGNLANKWCRAKIVFPTPTTYYGVFTNLTDGVSYTTEVKTISSPTTDQLTNFIFIANGNTSTAGGEIQRSIGFDYIQVQSRCPPIDRSNSVATSR